MIPVIISDLIRKTTDKNTKIHHRQFYYDTLVKINKATGEAIEDFEKEAEKRG
jgi:hypothetical protein